jgi:elongation factor G
VEKGVRQVLDVGPLAGYPVHDVRVIVYDGKYHDVDSKEIAFITAGKRAFMDAIGKARAIMLEPIVNIEITAPENNMGDIAGDLSSRRGQLSGTDSQSPGTLVIKGKVPLSELNNYQARLKSVTAGQGSYTMEFSHYDPVPPSVQKDLVAAHAKTAQAEEQ